MSLDIGVALAIVSQVVSFALGAWYLRGQFDAVRKEVITEAKSLFTAQQDFAVLSNKFDNMCETLSRMEHHLQKMADKE